MPQLLLLRLCLLLLVCGLLPSAFVLGSDEAPAAFLQLHGASAPPPVATAAMATPASTIAIRRRPLLQIMRTENEVQE